MLGMPYIVSINLHSFTKHASPEIKNPPFYNDFGIFMSRKGQKA